MSGRVEQARRLAEEALAAERAGDLATADRLFAEAERIDPNQVAAAVQEDEAIAQRRRTGQRAAPDQIASGIIPASASTRSLGRPEQRTAGGSATDSYKPARAQDDSAN